MHFFSSTRAASLVTAVAFIALHAPLAISAEAAPTVDTLKQRMRVAAATSTQPPAKQYHCVYFVGNQLVDAAPLTITGNSTYTDSEGKRGTFTSASSTLTFRGGNYDGQRAQYETSGGLPQLHILGPSGRPVIDCD